MLVALRCVHCAILPPLCRYNPRMIYRLLVFMIASVCSLTITAQRVHVKGLVRNAEGEGLGLCLVRVVGQPTATTLAKFDGQYAIDVAQQDSLTLIFSLIGYNTQRKLLLQPTDTVTLNVTLSSSDNLLDEALVTGQRVQTGQVQTLQTDALKLTASTSGNAVEDLVKAQAGVSSHNEMSSQYNVRGGSFDENSVYLNGIELFRPQLINSGQQEGLSVINSDMVEKIGFSTGGFEAKYGERMSSVLDITYKRVNGFEATVQGSLLGGGAYVGVGNKKVSLLTSVRYKTNAYLLGSLDTDGEYSPSFLDYQAYLSWRPTSKWTFDVLGNISDNTYDFTPKSRETKFGTLNDAKTFKVYFDGKEHDYFRTYFVAGTAEYAFTPKLRWSLTASHFLTKEAVTYDIQGQYWLNETQSTETLGVGTYQEHARNYLQAHVLNLGTRLAAEVGAHKLLVGLNLKHEKMRERAAEWEMRDSVGYALPHTPDDLRLIYSLRSEHEMNSKRLELFAQDTYRLPTKLGTFTFNYGLRYTHWDWNGESLLSPRFSVAYLPESNRRLTLRLATGLYYQAPFYKELRDTMNNGYYTAVALNARIRSPRSLHVVVGGDYTFEMYGRPFRFTAEAYYKYLTRIIPYSVDNMRIVYTGENMTEGYSAGIDLKLYGEFIPGTNSWLTFSLMSTKHKSAGQWLPLPTDQRYNFSVHFSDYFPNTDRWLLTLRGALAGGLPFSVPHQGLESRVFRAPAYKRVDIGLSYRLLNNEDKHVRKGFAGLLRNAWLGIDAFNVFGLNNVSSYYWVTDITNNQYAVPNYLTGRQVNLRFLLEF